MAVRSILFLILFFACIAIAGVRGEFDFGSGLYLTSGESLVMFRDLPKFQVELGITNYYSFSPLQAEERLFDCDWGALFHKKTFRGAVHVTYRNAFDLLKEVSTAVQGGALINQKFAINGEVTSRLLMIPDERDVEFDFGGAIAWHFSAVSLYSLYEISHVSRENERSIPLGELSIGTVLRDNILGSQSIAVRWNHTDKEGAVVIGQKYTLGNILTLSAAFQSFPVELGLAVLFDIRKVKTGILFRRHSDLGWSHSGVSVFQN